MTGSTVVNTGISLAFFAAILYGFREIYQKETVERTDEWVSSWAKRFFSAVVALPAVAIFGIPDVDWWEIAPYLIVNVLVLTVATVMLSKAFKDEQVSFLAPLSALSPIPLLITEPIVRGDSPSLIGIAGVFIIVSGVYLLKLDGATAIHEPLVRIGKNRSAQLVMGTTMLYSVTSTFDAVGVNSTSPIVWTILTSGLTGIALTPLMIVKTENVVQEIQSSGKSLVLFGSISGVALLFQMAALEHTLVVYMSAIKRLSIPIAVGLAFILYNETNLRGRLLGSLLTVAGSILVAFG